MVHYKFYYFNVRGRGEFVRFMFHQTNTSYEEVTIKLDLPFKPDGEWMQLKEKMPTGQVPVLEVDGHKIGTTIAIGNFLAKKLNLAGKDDIESALAIMIVDVVQDFIIKIGPLIGALVMKDENKVKEEWPKAKDEQVTPLLDKMERFLKENGTGFLVGKQLTWADLFVAEWFQRLHDSFDQSLLDKHPLVKQHVHMVHELPNIKKYIQQRPKMDF